MLVIIRDAVYENVAKLWNVSMQQYSLEIFNCSYLIVDFLILELNQVS